MTVVFAQCCRPPRHPQLRSLPGSRHWDAVIAVGISPAHTPVQPGTAAAAAAVATSAAAVAEATVTTAAAARAEQETNGAGLSFVDSDDSSRGSPPLTSATAEPDQADGVAESVLILGLRGQRHDLER